MRKLLLRIRIAWLDARIQASLLELNDLRGRRDRAQARLEEIKFRESRESAQRKIAEAMASSPPRVPQWRGPKPPPPAAAGRVVDFRRRDDDADVAVLAPGQPHTDRH